MPGWARSVFATAADRPFSKSAAGRKSRWRRFARALLDEDRGLHRHLVVELLYVRHRHADAAVGRGRAQRSDVRRAVDAGAVEDAHPARLEWVLRNAPRNHLAGEVAGPGALRDMPGGIDRLVLDVVEARRGVEAHLADCDLVRLPQLEVLEVAQPELATVDREHD